MPKELSVLRHSGGSLMSRSWSEDLAESVDEKLSDSGSTGPFSPFTMPSSQGLSHEDHL
jgi:hypothetical protein